MPITTFTPSLDMNLLTEFGGAPIPPPTETNCANSGGPPPTVNVTGLYSETLTAIDGVNNNVDNVSSQFSGAYAFTLKYADVLNPIPTNARIQKVDITMQSSGASANATTQIPSPSAINWSAYAEITFGVFSYSEFGNTNPLWLAEQTFMSDSQLDSGIASIKNASVSSGGIIARQYYDFTTNPNGDFPLQYMTYADFLTNLKYFLVQYNVAASSQIQIDDGGSTASAGATGGIDIQTANFQVEVTWTPVIVSSWEITSGPIVLPDGNTEIEIERPEATISPDEDVQQILIDDEPVDPDDPWVVIWLRFRIVLRFRPGEEPEEDEPDDTVEIKIKTFSGTVSLGTITITYADLSGIYRIDNTVHHDSLYDRSASPVVTDYEIPNPFLLTSFIASKEEDVSHFTGTRLRAVGIGPLGQIFQSLDNLNNVQLADLTLATVNNIEPFRLANLVDQRAALRVSLEGLDNYFTISKIVIFAKPVYTGYPQ